MAAFVRFVLTVLIVGMVLNFLIVMMANTQSTRRQTREMADDQQHLKGMVEEVTGRLRRADIVVESQQVDAHGTAIHSTLLVRQYGSSGSDQTRPLPVARVEIPENRVRMEGLLLSFDSGFAEDAPEYQWLRGQKLAYFGVVCGADENAPAKGDDPRFSFIITGEPPILTRLHPLETAPTYYERKLWQYLWDIIRESMVPATSAAPAAPAIEVAHTIRGVQILWTKPAEHVVRFDHTYAAFIDPAFIDPEKTLPITIDEDPAVNIPGLLDIMLEEGKKQKLEAGMPAVVPAQN